MREIAGGKVLRFDDLKRFSSIVTEIPEGAVLSSPRAREVQEAIEAALVRHIRKQPGMTPKAAYSLAIKLHEGQPPLTARTSESVALQQYSTPLPLSVAVQQVLGSFKGRSVLEPTIGNGSLVCTVKDAAVAGVELDVRRLDAIRRDRSEANIQHGDATSFDFRSLNGGGAFDVVLSNPPFGGLQPPRMMSGLKVSRVDHLIMIRSLQARADDGVGVYIIGADSYLDSQAGLVTGGSRYLFNWLADHYQVDAVEVDGGIYTKQGLLSRFVSSWSERRKLVMPKCQIGCRCCWTTTRCSNGLPACMRSMAWRRFELRKWAFRKRSAIRLSSSSMAMPRWRIALLSCPIPQLRRSPVRQGRSRRWIAVRTKRTRTSRLMRLSVEPAKLQRWYLETWRRLPVWL